MSLRVATFNTSARMIDATMRSQYRLTELQMQQATGKISTDYAGLGAVAGRVINVEVSQVRAQSFASAASLARNRVEVMYDAVGSLVDVLSTARAKIAQATDSVDPSGGTAINAIAQNLLEEAAGLMNTEFEGRFLFSGSLFNTKPVDLTVLAPVATSPTTADTSYYQGDDSVISARVGADNVVDYGVKASVAPFETTLRMLNLLANMSISPLDTTALAEASDLALTAIDGMTSIQANLSLKAQALETAQQDQLDYVDYADTLASSLSEVDIASVSAKLSIYETQLQASYSAIAKIQSLSLVDYLR